MNHQKKLGASHAEPSSIPFRPHIPDARSTKRTSDPIIFSIRGTPGWREWLKQYAAHRRISPTALIDQILAEAALRDGFAPPPARCSRGGMPRDERHPEP